MCPDVYQLDSACFLATPGLLWSAAFKNTKVKLDLLTDTDILLMVEKGVRGRICCDIFIDMLKLIANTWKIMIKIKNDHILSTGT